MSYETNVDYLLEDKTVKDMCKIADVDADACKIAFLSAKQNCAETEDQSTSLVDVIPGQDGNGIFSRQFFEKITNETSVEFTCSHFNLLEYGNYEDEHPESLVIELQEKRKAIADFAKTIVVAEDTVVASEPALE
jgi:hypothetical protein